MFIHQYTCVQKIPADINTIWDFFSSPGNLKTITPPYMGFEITSQNLPEKMFPGMIITYKVSPIAGIKLNWCTEITLVNEHDCFVDEQRQGPYNLWRHRHVFKKIDQGVEMTDVIHYKIPFGFLGNTFNPFLVRPKIKEIFDYRFKKTEELFGKY